MPITNNHPLIDYSYSPSYKMLALLWGIIGGFVIYTA